MIGRRNFLRGAAAAIALPWMESLAPRLAAGEPGAVAVRPPIRLVNCFFANGVEPKAWFPKEGGSDFALPFSLAPLEDLKSKLLVFDGLRNLAANKGHQAAISQWTAMKGSKTKGGGGDDSLSGGGPSFDQVVAAQIGRVTPIESLSLSADPPPSVSNLPFHYLSWRSADKPVARETDPRTVFEQLFGAKDADGNPLPMRPLEDDRSLLDLVLADAKSVRKDLGALDKAKLDEYLESIRGVERRIDFASRPDERTWRPPTAPERLVPPPEPEHWADRIRLLTDMTVLALWTDSTRVATLMFENESAGRNMKPWIPELSVAGHHANSHHQGAKDRIRNYQLITRWFVARYAELCRRLDAIEEGDGTLLDHSVVTLGANMDDGNRHRSDRIPTLIAGGAGGRLRTGRCLRYPKDTPVSALYLSLIRATGAQADRFAGQTEELPGLDGGEPEAVPNGKG